MVPLLSRGSRLLTVFNLLLLRGSALGREDFTRGSLLLRFGVDFSCLSSFLRFGLLVDWASSCNGRESESESFHSAVWRSKKLQILKITLKSQSSNINHNQFHRFRYNFIEIYIHFYIPFMSQIRKTL